MAATCLEMTVTSVSPGESKRNEEKNTWTQDNTTYGNYKKVTSFPSAFEFQNAHSCVTQFYMTGPPQTKQIVIDNL